MFRALPIARLAAAASLLLPLVAQAAGLGRLTVQSALGQPLRAEVEIVSVQRGEQESLNARIASPDAFRTAGIEFTAIMANIRVAIERRDGRPVLRLSSTQPVNEPFVELLLELQWSNGRLVREYTFLLDPTEYKAPKPVAATPPPPPVVAKPAPATPAPAKPAAPAEPKSVGTYEVKRGDTLSKVARESKAPDVTVNQMLVALYRANQSAFIRNNMYLMRSGEILKIPERAAAVAVDPKEATRLVKEHSVEFDEYRRGLGASVAVAPAKPTPPSQRETPGKIAPKPPEAPAKQPKDQIKLSKAEAGAGQPSTKAGKAAIEDNKTALNRALKESQSRVADLEKQISDLKKLIELKNQQLAILEQKAGGKPPAAAPAPAPAPVVPKPPAEPAKPAAAPAKPAAEAPKPAPEAAKAPVPAPAPPPAATPKAPPATAKPKPPPAPPPEPSLMDEFTENPLALGGLAGVLALLGGYGWWAWRRKKVSQSRDEGFGALAAEPAAPSAPPSEPSPQVAAALAAAQSAGATTSAVEEVDPIAEADVYLAYGRDSQAESILKDALSVDPDRLIVHAKLAEIYAQRKDKAAFEQAALKIKSLTGGSGPEWEKAAGLGRSLDPENGLYGSGPAVAAADAPAPAASSPAPNLDFDIGSITSPGPSSASAASVDFDLGATTGEQASAASVKPGDTVVMSAQDLQGAKLDFDINAAAPQAAAPKVEPAPAPAEPAPLDFDLDFDMGKSEPAPAPAASVDPKWQEIATKLDLAKAYQEMGDKNGARELLDEVMKEGDAAQQEEAKRILAKLG